MAKALTQIAIDNLKSEANRREVPDGKISGLFLIVQPSGARSWALRYRFNEVPRKFTIGSYPALGLADARKRAQEALGAIAGGIDPGVEKQAAKAAAKAASKGSSDSVEHVIADFVRLYAVPNTRDWRETERLLAEFGTAWKGRALADIGKADIHRVLDAVVARGAPVTANRKFAQLRKLCGWAVSRGILDKNPCADIERPSSEEARDRVLDAEELQLIWRGADGLGFPFGPIVKLLILTGARRSEIGGMEWSEIDLEKRLWTLPAARSKNHRALHLPLSPQAFAIIKALPKFHGSKYLFSPGATAPSGFSVAKKRLDRLIAASTGGAALAPWILHDLRRSTASGLASLGVNLAVIERTLNHVSGSFGGVAGIYQRHSFADEMRDALERWGRHIDGLVSEDQSNLIELRRQIR
jgi:integrase